MPLDTLPYSDLEPRTAAFYCHAVDALTREGVPFLVGGAYALGRYTGIVRHTKDFDIFVRPEDCRRILDLFAAEGYRCELTFPHWLGKVYADGDFIDVIYSSGNGIATVDDEWFAHAVVGEVLGREVRLCPVEEIIWSKGFIMERERFDGADVAHLLRARAADLSWPRLLRRFGKHWRVLFTHLVLFGYVYPSERDRIPATVMEELIGRLRQELTATPADEHVCQGTILSREQYLIDIRNWGYEDARLKPRGRMNGPDIDHWTAAIADDPMHIKPH